MVKDEELFRGFIPTKDKRGFTDDWTHKYWNSIEEVKKLPIYCGSYGGVLADGIIVIDVDNMEDAEILLSIVKTLKLKTRVYKTTHGMHFYFKNTKLTTGTVKIHCAIGIEVDYRLGQKQMMVLCLNNVVREVIYDCDSLDYIPKFLYPIKKAPLFRQLTEGSRNQTLFNYELTLKANGFKNDEIKSTIVLINSFILPDPLSDKEIEVITREEGLQKEVTVCEVGEFVDSKGKIQFRAFCDYFIQMEHIVLIDGTIHIYRNGVYSSDETKIENAMFKYIPTITTPQRREVLNTVKALVVESLQKRAPTNLIKFKNGVLNICTKELVDDDPSLIFTNTIAFDYNADAYSEAMDKTLNKLACDDEKTRMLIEEMVGYSMYRSNEYTKAFFLLGDKSNGKSTFLDVLSYMLGDDNTTSLPLQELSERFSKAEMLNKLAIISDDIPKTWIPDASMFKKVTSGDRITAEFKGLKPFNFRPYCTPIYSANNMPRIEDTTGAVKRRIVPISFDAKFSKADPDYNPRVKYQLKTDEAIEYLIKIAVDGLRRLLKNDEFTMPDKSKKLLEFIDYANNPLIGFVEEYGEENIVNQPVDKVFDAYRSYCVVDNIKLAGKTTFRKNLSALLKLEERRVQIDGQRYCEFVKATVIPDKTS